MNSDAFLARGNRLVITFFPQTGSYESDENENETNSVKSAPSQGKRRKNDTATNRRRKETRQTDDEDMGVDLTERWGFDVNFIKLTQAGDVYEPAQVVNQTDLPLPRRLDWHSGTDFHQPGSCVARDLRAWHQCRCH